jgi:hypothetical protein
MVIYSEIGKAGLLKLYTDYTRSDEWRAKNHSRVAVAAYYKAQARGFEPGKEIQDWLEAESEIARLCVPPHEFFV